MKLAAQYSISKSTHSLITTYVRTLLPLSFSYNRQRQFNLLIRNLLLVLCTGTCTCINSFLCLIGTSRGDSFQPESAVLKHSPLLTQQEANTAKAGMNRVCDKCRLRQATKLYMPCTHATCNQCEESINSVCPHCFRLISTTIRVFSA